MTRVVLELVLRAENQFEPHPENEILVFLGVFKNFRRSFSSFLYGSPPPPPAPSPGCHVTLFCQNISDFTLQVYIQISKVLQISNKCFYLCRVVSFNFIVIVDADRVL